jgi:hypothetical protein
MSHLPFEYWMPGGARGLHQGWRLADFGGEAASSGRTHVGRRPRTTRPVSNPGGAYLSKTTPRRQCHFHRIARVASDKVPSRFRREGGAKADMQCGEEQ